MRYLFLLLALAGALLFSQAPKPTQAQVPSDVIPGRFLVGLRAGLITPPDVRLVDINALEAQYGFRSAVAYRTAFSGFAANLTPAQERLVRADARVAFVEPDRIMKALPQNMPTGIDRAQADVNAAANINGSGADLDVNVAVLDTGVDIDHPDLRVNSVGFAQYAQCTANCSGSPTLSCAQNATWDDEHGHGTHVAGTIGARDNTIGVVGMAPGARIWPVRVLGSHGWGCTSDIIAGIDWVASHADVIHVANMSLGGGSYSPMCTAINNAINAGVTFVVAAGNSATNASNSSPANCTNAITVSAIADFDGKPGGLGSGSQSFGPPVNCTENADDSFACFSNYGSVVDIAAPGVRILSTYMGGGTATMSGTSMASPHVAGAAALVKLGNFGLTPAQVRTSLLNSAFAQNGSCGYNGESKSTVPLLNMGGACQPAANTPPAVTAVSPINGASGVSVNTNVTATFSEAMNSSSVTAAGTFTLTGPGGAIAASVSYNSTTRVATLNPTPTLANGTTYTARITTAAQDSQNLGMAADYTWTFTTAAGATNSPPQVSTTSPASGATGVATGANITATFNEAMNASSINTSTFTLSGPSGGIGGGVSYDATSRVATLNPTVDLAAGTTYTATVTTGAQDSAGLGMVSNYVWSFTTVAGPTNTPPQVSTTSPAGSASGVAVGANITATFNEAMNASTINTSTFSLSGPSGSVGGAVSYNTTSRIATFDPSANLAAGTTYTATVTTGVQDSAGLGMASNYVWSFTTATAPTSTACAAPVIATRSDSSAAGGGTVSFTWNAVGGATEYTVQRLDWWGLAPATMATTGSTSFTGTDSWDDPNWRVFVSAGSCTPIPGPMTTFDP